MYNLLKALSLKVLSMTSPITRSFSFSYSRLFDEFVDKEIKTQLEKFENKVFKELFPIRPKEGGQAWQDLQDVFLKEICPLILSYHSLEENLRYRKLIDGVSAQEKLLNNIEIIQKNVDNLIDEMHDYYKEYQQKKINQNKSKRTITLIQDAKNIRSKIFLSLHPVHSSDGRSYWIDLQIIYNKTLPDFIQYYQKIDKKLLFMKIDNQKSLYDNLVKKLEIIRQNTDYLLNELDKHCKEIINN